MVPVTEWEAVDELIERVIRRMAPYLLEHPIGLELPRDLPPMRLDPMHIEQALANLLENAAKYSPPAAPITVAAGVSELAGRKELFIAVRDEGIGVARSELELIFDKFYRSGGAPRGASSAGMGLAIVKGLIEAHGGRVVAESVLTQGSCFSMFLPLDEHSSVADERHGSSVRDPVWP